MGIHMEKKMENDMEAGQIAVYGVSRGRGFL